jgi:hypothetical protein
MRRPAAIEATGDQGERHFTSSFGALGVPRNPGSQEPADGGQRSHSPRALASQSAGNAIDAAPPWVFVRGALPFRART